MTMHRPIAKTAAETMLALQFAALATSDPDRVAAFAAFEAEGLPTRRNEAWHYTDLRSAMTEAAPLAPAPDARRIEAARALLATRERIGDVRFVVVDGHFVPQNCPTARPPGCRPGSSPKSVPASKERAPSSALNDAFSAGGLALC